MASSPLASTSPDGATAAYIDLIKRVLTNWIYGEDEARLNGAAFDAEARLIGKEWPPPMTGHSMIGHCRLNNVHECVEKAIQEKIPGDLLEAGVWRGGASILMKAILHVFGDKERTVWLADSFAGLPPPNPKLYPHDKDMNLNQYAVLAIPEQQVQRNFERYGLFDSRVRFLKGWFKDTLHKAPVQQLSVLRLDGDLYESTMDTLVPLYPKVAPGGFVIIDDYGVFEACKHAVHDYRDKHGITEPMIPVDWSAVYWRKRG